jgi:hypothetical protein
MSDVSLNVRPSGPGWQVDGGLNTQPLMFLSGAKAEAQAHALARCIASTGSDARVVIQDRGEQVVGATRYLADGR